MLLFFASIRNCLESYALSAVKTKILPFGKRNCLMFSSKNFESCTFAAPTAIETGIPLLSTIMLFLMPYFPLSVGLFPDQLYESAALLKDASIE
ncbi:MAG TPA: hypothetical protein QGF02_01755 [Candidatus Babeliales bacterium]|nr:hypothetical protein [Candidatus Babeliales bacterium]